MAILSKEEILAAVDLPEEVISIPEWGGDVKVRGMSAEERVRWLKETQDDKGQIDPEKAAYIAVIYGVTEPKFTQEDVPALKQKSASAIDRISRAWLRLSGVGDEELAKVRGNS